MNNLEIVNTKQRLQSSIELLTKNEYQKVQRLYKVKGVTNPFVYLRLIILATFLGIENKYEMDIYHMRNLVIFVDKFHHLIENHYLCVYMF